MPSDCRTSRFSFWRFYAASSLQRSSAVSDLSKPVRNSTAYQKDDSPQGVDVARPASFPHGSRDLAKPRICRHIVERFLSNQAEMRIARRSADCLWAEKWLQSRSRWAYGFMCGSGATTGNKMMGVQPIFFCRSVHRGSASRVRTNVRRLGARPALVVCRRGEARCANI